MRPKITETTALGAAYLAGLAVGLWSGMNDIKRQRQIDRVFSPRIKKKDILSLIQGWRRAVDASQVWASQTDVSQKRNQHL
jgi:glycerol kinase